MGTNSSLKQKNDLISRLFFSLLPVQVLIYAMGFINTIVDGIMAGRFIDSTTVGVVGLYFSMVNVLNATSSVLLGGTTVVCGRYLGRGDVEKTKGVFSLNITVTFIVAAFLALISAVIPGPLADLLGANAELRGDLMKYIAGYAVGIIPMLLAQQIAAFLQMERQNKRGYIGIAGMIIANVFLDILLVAVLKLGITGLALATSLSNWVYFLILAPYYLTKKAQLKYDRKNILWSELPEIIKIGFPGALLIFCLAIRAACLNRILIHYAGNAGLSALSAFNMISGIFIAFCVGTGNVVRMLVSVFVGEEDRNSMKKVLKTALTKGIAMSIGVAAVVVIIAPILSGLFFPDRSSEVYTLTKQLFIIYGLCTPLVMLAQISINYFQATGHNVFVNVVSLVDGLLSVVIPAALLAPVLGAFGVWLANPIGITITILCSVVYVIFSLKRFPKNAEEWMLLKPNFGVAAENCLDISIKSMEDVAGTAELVQEFCDKHDMAARPSYYAALCLEEMAGNVIRHGFTADKKNHYLNARVVYLDDTVLLRLKDDCQTFDPSQLADFVSAESEFNSIGLKMVYKIADEVSYQNLLGLNVLTISIHEDNIAAMDVNDYLLERKLKEEDPELHQIFKDTAFVAQRILSKYKTLFPDYTDHSQFHSLTVIDSCNKIIGREQIDKMNKDEAFILLMGCYLHDIGMGISEHDYEEFKDVMGAEEYFKEHPNADKTEFVRTYHNDFSGLFIDKYAGLFDLPSDEYVYAIKQVARGHRKTDLYDEKEYPVDYKLPNGNTVCLPYLAALLRLSDEIDVAASRNPLAFFDIELITNEESLLENKKLMAIKQVKMTKSAFIIEAVTDDKEIIESIDRAIIKMQETLDLCREVTEKRTKFVISQKRVVLRRRDK